MYIKLLSIKICYTNCPYCYNINFGNVKFKNNYKKNIWNK